VNVVSVDVLEVTLVNITNTSFSEKKSLCGYLW
jgi:hypothetical protein